MSDLFHVSSAPHVRAKDSTSRIMLYVCIALSPSCLFSIIHFGFRALLIYLVAVLSCVGFEYLFQLIRHKKNTIDDLSAVVTGLLLAANVPVSIPIWEVILGSCFAIVIVKMLFGGLGQNFMNPALGARCFLLLAFTADMTNFAYDSFSGATPLAVLREYNGKIPSNLNVVDMLVGNTAGTLGETSVLCILLGAIFLIMLGVINLRIPGAYILSFAIFVFLFGPSRFDFTYVVAELCGGGLMLGAFFMATDYSTSPITPMGQIIFGICCGVLTGLFRVFGANAEGVSFAIILSNLLVPIIEKYTVPRAFGVKKEGKKHE